MERRHGWPLIGGVLMAIGSFLPWAQSEAYALAGTAGDGIFILIGGTIVIFLAVTHRIGLVPGVTVILVGILGGLIVGRAFRSLTPSGLEIAGGPSAGIGLFIAGAGSLIAAMTGINLLRPKPRSTEEAPPFL